METSVFDGRIRLDNSCGFRAGVEVDGKLYYSARDRRNALYEVDYGTGRVTFLGSFLIHSEHDFCCCFGKKIWFFPMNGKRNQIDIYDMESKQFSIVDIPAPSKENSLTYGGKFVSVLEHKGYRYIIPGTYNYIIKVGKNDQIDSYIQIPQQYLKGLEKKFIDALIYDETIYFCPYDSDYMLKMSLDYEKFEALEWNYGKKLFGKICVYQGKVYVIPVKGNVNIVSIKRDFSEIEEMPIALRNESETYVAIGYINGTVWMFPDETSVICRISLKEQKVEYIEVLTESVYRNNLFGYRNVMMNEKGLTFVSCGEGTPFAKIDETGTLSFFSIYISVQENLNYLCKRIENMSLQKKESRIGVKIYLKVSN